MNIRYKFLLTLLAGVASSALFLPNASAVGTVTLDYGIRQTGNGGEFNAASSDAALDPATLGYVTAVGPDAGTMANVGHGMGFETFCLEEGEFFTPGNSYYYAISQAAIHGGIANGSDPISLGTAWLYLNFAQGTLAGYTYATGAGGNSSAAALQATVWWLEGEQATNPNNTFSNAVISQFGSAAGAMADNNGFYGVGVLNLWGDIGHTELAQDQLVLIPGPGQQSTPDGGTTAMLLGLGLLGIFLGNRKLSPKTATA